MQRLCFPLEVLTKNVTIFVHKFLPQVFTTHNLAKYRRFLVAYSAQVENRKHAEKGIRVKIEHTPVHERAHSGGKRALYSHVRA